jgi:hypothetical protein
MGGNLFKNTATINKKSVRDTVDSLFNSHLSVLGVQKYSYIGSTGKSNVSGDVDLCISCSPQNKVTLSKRLQQRLGDDNVKVSGQNIAVKYPISGSHNRYVQIDLMLAEKDKLDDVTWLMSGDSEQGVKGVYRNLMFCHIAKKVSNKMKDDEKITISFPGGLQHKKFNGKKWVGKNEKITNPHQILKILGINKDPKNVITYMQLIDHMIDDKVLNSYLEDFSNYVNNYIVSDPESANRATWYIKTKTRLKNEQEDA